MGRRKYRDVRGKVGVNGRRGRQTNCRFTLLQYNTQSYPYPKYMLIEFRKERNIQFIVRMGMSQHVLHKFIERRSIYSFKSESESILCS